MKSNLHPTYHQTNITCACGNTFSVGGVSKDLKVDVCAKCHPFFTGTQKFVDTLGRVDKFIAKRQAAVGYTKKDKATSAGEAGPAKSLKEMLTVKKLAESKDEESK